MELPLDPLCNHKLTNYILQPGCGICSENDNKGTVGGFVRCKSSGHIGFLTSFHLFFNFKNDNPRPCGGEAVYLQNQDEKDILCGTLSQNRHQQIFTNIKYENAFYGIDAIFVIIKNISWQPHVTLSMNEIQQFPELPEVLTFSAPPLPVEELNSDMTVYKYGHKTKLTQGTFVTRNTAVKDISMAANELIPKGPVDVTFIYSFVGDNMILVKDKPGIDIFAGRGDSGSFVFVVKDGVVRLIGIMEGSLSDGIHMVIPILPALNHMGLEVVY